MGGLAYQEMTICWKQEIQEAARKAAAGEGHDISTALGGASELDLGPKRGQEKRGEGEWGALLHWPCSSSQVSLSGRSL